MYHMDNKILANQMAVVLKPTLRKREQKKQTKDKKQ